MLQTANESFGPPRGQFLQGNQGAMPNEGAGVLQPSKSALTLGKCNQSIDQGVVQESVPSSAQALEEGWNGLRPPQTSESRGRFSSDRGVFVCDDKRFQTR